MLFRDGSIGWSRRLLIVVAAAGMVLSLLAAINTAAAEAYPQQTNNCNDRTLHWEFQTNTLWTAGGVDRRPWARAGIGTINDEKSYDGTTLVTVTEDGGIDVQIRDEPVSNYGSSECSGGASIWVNSNYSDAKFYWRMARHEMLHLAGMEHGGKDDSMNSDNPASMATCINHSTFRTVNNLDQDTAAYENWLHNAAGGR